MTSTTKGSAKGALGSVLGSVQAAGNAVTGLFETAADSVGILSNYVGAAAEKQRIAIDYDLATHEERLLDDLSTEEAKRTREIKVFFAEAPENAKAWQDANARIKAAVAARRNPGQQQAA